MKAIRDSKNRVQDIAEQISKTNNFFLDTYASIMHIDAYENNTEHR
jgi:hypothetical protein